MYSRVRLRLVLAAVMWAAAAASGCDQPEPLADGAHGVKTSYDKTTGKLQQLTYDSNFDGIDDTFSFMDGSRVIRIEMDKDQDGKIDRWEYYDTSQKLEKVGYSRANDGKVDAWAYKGKDGPVAKIEMATRGDGKIDRIEYYTEGVLARVELDSNGDGSIDQWDNYALRRLQTTTLDENHDGRPDRRLTYGPAGVLLTVESEPDASGTFRRKIAVKR